MDDTDRIKIGDRVQVDFNGSRFTLSRGAEVLYIPLSSSDSWIFKGCSDDTDDVWYVSEGCTVTKLRVNNP